MDISDAFSRLERFYFDIHSQELWDSIIVEEGFYNVEVYYQITGELLPWNASEKWKALSKEEQKAKIIIEYGERPADNSSLFSMGYFVRSLEGKMIAWILWKYNNTDNHAILQYIIIIESHQNKGIGGKLITLFLEWCIENEKEKASLIYKNSEQLTKFYNKYGFFHNSCDNFTVELGAFVRSARIIKRPLNKYKKMEDIDFTDLFV